jgi:hypothetical protein
MHVVNARLVSALPGNRRRSIHRLYQSLFNHVEWNIGLIRGHISQLLDCNAKLSIQWFPRPQRGKYIADPFAMNFGNRIILLCEEFDDLTRKGRIVSLEIAADGRTVSKPTVAIESAVHMSYPYLLRHKGEIYCIPETAQAREISIYKAKQFPSKWAKVATLVGNFSGVDATVFQYDGSWWLTCGSKEDASQKLFVWHSKDPLGPWTPHAANPVKTDARSSRPAGTPFTHGGDFYRPAQDCSETYGKRIVINRIVTLTPDKFKEEPASVVEPDIDSSYPNGVHTVSAVENITIVDGKRITFSVSALKHARRQR